MTLKYLLENNVDERLLYEYKNNMPVSDAPSLMNKICHTFENEFDRYFSKKENKIDFDYSIYINADFEYSKYQYDSVKRIKSEYDENIKRYFINKRDGLYEESELEKSRDEIVKEFKENAEKLCENEFVLCNILINLCYKENKGKSKQFAWDVSGETIIKNLLLKNNNEITYFIKDTSGVIDFAGETFTMKKKKVDMEEVCQ